MSIFSRSINKRLADHIAELDAFGFLPENWMWYKPKVQKLKDINEDLINDLKKLHGRHEDIPEMYWNVMPFLLKLHEDLKKMLAERPAAEVQKKEADAVNALLKQVKGMIDRYSRKTQDPYFAKTADALEKDFRNAGYWSMISKEVQQGIFPWEDAVRVYAKIKRDIYECALFFPFMENLVRIFKEKKINVVYAIDCSGRILGFLLHSVLMSMGLSGQARFYFMNVALRENANLYSEKQKKMLKGKRVLLVDEYISTGNTITRAASLLNALVGKEGDVYTTVFSVKFCYDSRAYSCVATGVPSWYGRKEYAGVKKSYHGPVEVDKGSLKIARDIRRRLAEMAKVIAVYLKRKGY